MKRLVASIVHVLFMCFGELSLGDTVTEIRTSSNSYLIPVFDVRLGTLTSVRIERILLGSSETEWAGEHTHRYNGVMPMRQDIFDFPHDHTFMVPVVAGNGLTLSVLSHSTELMMWSHTHPLMPNELLVAGSHTHGVDEVAVTDFFSNADVLPFLGPFDFSISLPAITTSSAGLHSHTFFPMHQTTPSTHDGNHSHIMDLDFVIRATFMFEPVPEPPSLVFVGFALLALSGFRLRYRNVYFAA